MNNVYYNYLVKFYGFNKCVVEEKVFAVGEFEAKTIIMHIHGLELSEIISVEIVD